MTNLEFREWLAYHTKAYPGVAKWLADHDGQAEMWAKVLGKTGLAAAKKATDSLFEADEQPRGYGEHPRAIKRLAWESRPPQRTKRIDGEDTFRCSRCRDSGVVSVANPATLRAAWANQAMYGVRWCGVACDCEEGYRFAVPPKGVTPMLRWHKDHALFSFEEVCDQARSISEKSPLSHLFEAVRQLMVEHDANRTRGESIDEVQFSAPYPGDF